MKLLSLVGNHSGFDPNEDIEDKSKKDDTVDKPEGLSGLAKTVVGAGLLTVGAFGALVYFIYDAISSRKNVSLFSPPEEPKFLSPEFRSLRLINIGEKNVGRTALIEVEKRGIYPKNRIINSIVQLYTLYIETKYGEIELENYDNDVDNSPLEKFVSDYFPRCKVFQISFDLSKKNYDDRRYKNISEYFDYWVGFAKNNGAPDDAMFMFVCCKSDSWDKNGSEEINNAITGLNLKDDQIIKPTDENINMGNLFFKTSALNNEGVAELYLATAEGYRDNIMKIMKRKSQQQS
ncbi:MAG: hypothetical protein CfP315_0776 [Candidatus Improbicoccus pseudotrichonymphae]|uniref:Uncharacterized protein n=1 Tax=Candidatus Improbicoccus pseudotrichonymphae TaxID=3033792 RepID=A0AA48IB03_9FIRM|nr:MAG: hypothetical protein CfP315_0776 [Candidatus Improbicoccus pseudotrichonymphae]